MNSNYQGPEEYHKTPTQNPIASQYNVILSQSMPMSPSSPAHQVVHAAPHLQTQMTQPYPMSSSQPVHTVNSQPVMSASMYPHHGYNHSSSYPGGGSAPPPYAPPPPTHPGQYAYYSHPAPVVSSPQVMNNPRFGEAPVQTHCNSCQQRGSTNVEYVVGTYAMLIGLVMAFFGLIPCCLIPCCLESCKDVRHSCSHCGQVLGTYRRL